MRIGAVVLYETKPATEWLLGGPVRKVSPRWAHAALQGAFVARLQAWARGRGRAGTEWRFWVAPPGEEPRYLVPDVAYLSYARLPAADYDAAQEPRMAPDLAVEIVSPSDRPEHRAHKVDVYLRAGAAAVVEVDPLRRVAIVFDRSGVRELSECDAFEHPALPGFILPLQELFAELHP